MFAYATDTETTETTERTTGTTFTATATTVDWALARCADPFVAAEHGTTTLGDLFFSEQIPEIRAAKAICAGCALQVPCLEGATERREPWGVWGGQLFQNGKVLPVKRPRGRPPKDPARQLTA